jgi:hypothetical protein
VGVDFDGDGTFQVIAGDDAVQFTAGVGGQMAPAGDDDAPVPAVDEAARIAELRRPDGEAARDEPRMGASGRGEIARVVECPGDGGRLTEMRNIMPSAITTTMSPGSVPSRTLLILTGNTSLGAPSLAKPIASQRKFENLISGLGSAVMARAPPRGE